MKAVRDFEDSVKWFYGSKYAVATDSCTHALELCLRLLKPNEVSCPSNTYLSVPMTFDKLGLFWDFTQQQWEDYYYISDNIIDAAVYWKRDSYIPNTFMCLSFQYKKHLGLGRGGMILLDDPDSAIALKKMSYDGRLPDIPWAEQNVDMLGYHYYMTPEVAEQGMTKLARVCDLPPRKWSYKDYPDVSSMKVFQ